MDGITLTVAQLVAIGGGLVAIIGSLAGVVRSLYSSQIRDLQLQLTQLRLECDRRNAEKAVVIGAKDAEISRLNTALAEQDERHRAELARERSESAERIEAAHALHMRDLRAWIEHGYQAKLRSSTPPAGTPAGPKNTRG